MTWWCVRTRGGGAPRGKESEWYAIVPGCLGRIEVEVLGEKKVRSVGLEETKVLVLLIWRAVFVGVVVCREDGMACLPFMAG